MSIYNISIDLSIDSHRSVGWDLNPFDNVDNSHRTCHNDPQRAWSSSVTESGELKIWALESESLRVASIHFRSEANDASF